MRLEEHLGQPRRAQHLVGDRGPALALEGVEARQRVFAQNARPVGGAGGGRVEGGDRVLPRRPAFELHDHVIRHFLRRDELHLPQRGHGGELVTGEQAVFSHVDVRAVERLARLLPAGRSGAERRGDRQRRGHSEGHRRWYDVIKARRDLANQEIQSR